MSLWRVTTEITGTYVNGGGVQRFYFREGGGTAAQAHAAVATFWTGCHDMPHTSTTFLIAGEVESVDENTGQVTAVTSVTPVSVAGLSSEDPMPPANQALVQWRSGSFLNGREIRGRTFIPALTEGDWNSGAWSGTRAANVVAAANALVASANADLCIFSPTHLTYRVVTSAALWSKVATLRSRRD
jgi:hypothetical protein